MKGIQNQIQVSFVIPVYNAQDYLEECLDSLLGQTLKEIEIICVDDGSKDESLSLLQKYETVHSVIRVLENKAEGPGAGQARNMGLDHATGEFVHVVDADDYFHPEMAEKLYKKATSTEADIVMFDVLRFEHATRAQMPDGTALRREFFPSKSVFSGEDLGDSLFQITGGAAWNKMIRRSFLEEYQFRFQVVHVMDDIFFTYTSLAVANRIVVVEESLLYYRYNNSQSQFSNKDRDPLTPVKVGIALKEWLERQQVFSHFSAGYYPFVTGLCELYLYDLQEENVLSLFTTLQEGALAGMGFLSPLFPDGMKLFLSLDVTLEDFLSERKKRGMAEIGKGTKCAIYGFGRSVHEVFGKIEEKQGVCVAIADGAKEKQGQVFQGIAVCAPEDLHRVELDLILISSPFYYEVMKGNLLGLGFGEEQIALI